MTNTSHEIWKDIKGFENLYQVSNLGNVKTLGNMARAKCIDKNGIRKPQINHKGYLGVILHKDGIYYQKLIHRLVAEAFIPNPENKQQVNHIDTNKQNNCVENLEWTTQDENMAHAASHGIYKKISPRQKEAQLKNIIKAIEAEKKQVVKINPYTGECEEKYNSIIEASRSNGINSSDIIDVCKGRREFAGKYKWVYLQDYENDKMPLYKGISRKYPECRNHGNVTVEQRENIAKEYEDGLTTREIANKYDVSLDIVRKAIKQFGTWEYEKTNYNIDLNTLADEIQSGKTIQELAEKYQCPRNLISVKKRQLRKAGKIE